MQHKKNKVERREFLALLSARTPIGHAYGEEVCHLCDENTFYLFSDTRESVTARRL